MPKVQDLKLKRFFDFSYIPRSWLEESKDEQYHPDRLYPLGPMILASPGNYLWVLTDEDNKIKGAIWAAILILSRQLHINFVLLDPEYRSEHSPEEARVEMSFIVGFLKNEVAEINKKLEIEKSDYRLSETLLATTTRWRAYESMGWKKHKQVLMEI